MSFRESVGLPSDRATVVRRYASADGDSTVYGVPLTRQEQSVVDTRVRYSYQFMQLLAEMGSDPTYGGSYLDKATGRVLTALTSGDPIAFQTAYAKLVPTGGELTVVGTKWSLAAIDARIADIGSRLADVGGHSVHFDPVTQLFGVGIAEGTEATILADRSDSARLMLGSDVVLEPLPKAELLACTIADCGTRGGLEIRGRNSPTSAVWALCTSGFVARDKGNNAMRMLTAGHCIEDAGGAADADSQWRNEAQTITWGRNIAERFFDGTTSDSGVFALGSNVPTTKNSYFISATNQKPIVHASTDAEQTLGMLVCRSGRASDYDCGTIAIWHQWQEPKPGFILKDTIVVNVTSAHGDSGAGFIGTYDEFGNRFAAGILSGGDGGWTWYTGVQAAQAQMNIKVCTSAAC